MVGKKTQLTILKGLVLVPMDSTAISQSEKSSKCYDCQFCSLLFSLKSK